MTIEGQEAKMDVTVDETVEITTEMTQPVIIDLGEQKAKKLKMLKRGEGALWDEVFDVLEEVKDLLGEEADGKVMIPVVMIYEKKAKRQSFPDFPRIRFE